MDKVYDIDFLLDAIQEYIAPIKGKTEWGYTPAYFLSARFNVHRNYAEYYLQKGDLTHRDMDHILAGYDRSKATAFDEEYAELKYNEYKNQVIDDKEDFQYLQHILREKKILVLAPGSSIRSEKNYISDYIAKEQVVTIAVNFVPEDFEADYIFFSNSKRFSQAADTAANLIITSNIETDKKAIKLNYNVLSSSFDQGCNSMVMLIKLLKDIGVSEIAVAGADGYVEGERNYYKTSLRSTAERSGNYNVAVHNAIHRIGMKVNFITRSLYE